MAMKLYSMRVRLTFIEEVLGTASANPNIHSEFIASKAPDAPSMAEEVAAIGADGVERKEMTVFPRTKDGRPFLWDYQLKGYFKGVCGFLRRVPGTEASKVKAYKKTLDGLLFPQPRRAFLRLPEEAFDEESGIGIGNCQRPLRAETAQGERVALANSESVPAGTTVEFTISTLSKDLLPFIKEALDYGALSGIGQWRNSGKGRFTWEEIADDSESDAA